MRNKLVQSMLLTALWLTPAATAGPVALTIDVLGETEVAELWRPVRADTVATPSLASMMSAGRAFPWLAFITTTGGGGVGFGEQSEPSHTSLWEAVYTRGAWRGEGFTVSGGVMQIVSIEASSVELFEDRGRGRSASSSGIARAKPAGFLDRRAPPPPPPSTPLPSAGLMACAGLALLGARRRR